MKNPLHAVYIAGSFLAALVAAVGTSLQVPFLYGIVPGLIGGTLAAVAAFRFFRKKEDLAGFVATACGFIFYQAYQGNPVMLPEFAASLMSVPPQDQVVGMVLANLTTAFLLLACDAAAVLLAPVIGGLVPAARPDPRPGCDPAVSAGFWLTFALVAVPNVLFGQVVVGAIRNIVYQRMAWGEAENYSGFTVWGGGVGASVANLALWATSLFLLWLYLLRSRHRWSMRILGPLVLLWTASVALQGSRTYIVTIGFAVLIYVFGKPGLGLRGLVLAGLAGSALFLLVQISTHFRDGGLQSVNLPELSSRILEIRGNEGASAQMDGIEYFRTELLARGAAPNPVTGFLRGLLVRPLEGVFMIVPRSLFPWKPDDASAIEFTLFYQNVRMGVASDETFMGASPGLIGRELIKYGLLGPVTLLFWLGSILALADRFYRAGPASDFHRICAALLVAFIVAQCRDFVPIWFIPFLPAAVVLLWVARRTRIRQASAAP